jgi:uncharacterized protein YukE
MAQMGMDVEAVESIGRQLKQSATSVEGLVGSIDRTVGSLLPIWDGPDAQRFVQQAWPQHRKYLLAAQSSVAGLGQSALNNASEQREASQAITSHGLMGSTALSRSAARPSGEVESHVESNWNGTVAHVTEHPNAATTISDDAQSGIRGTVDGKVGPDHGTLSAEGSLHGEAGIRASETNTHDLGSGTTFTDTGESFAGAQGDLSGTASVGAEGANLHAGGDLFAGSEADIRAQFAGEYGTAGIGAGVMAGIGVKGNAHVDLGWGHIGLGIQLGASLGVGVQVQPSLDFSPKSIVDNLLGVSW